MQDQPLGLHLMQAAVLGRPIAHSLSPVLHRAAYAALGLDWGYSAIDCGIEDLPSVLAERADWAGFSCTMPLKRAAFDVADVRSAAADAVGAANTLLPDGGGRWRADNTDVDGIAAALAERGVHPGRPAILGAGGTAQAAVVALRGLGVERCRIHVRDAGRTAELAAAAQRVGMVLDIVGLTHSIEADLIVSTLPRGAADQLAGRRFTPGCAVLDAVYDPWPTPLAAAVAAAGGTVVSGALMLLHQACAQVELMTGRAAPVEAMRAALREAAPNAGV